MTRTERQAFKTCIRIVQRFSPAKDEWEIRYWEVKKRLLASIRTALSRRTSEKKEKKL